VEKVKCHMGAIAAGHPETLRAAQITLEEGGNAFDAVMAAMVASSITEPTLSSMGGGGFLMAAPTGENPVIYDFFTQTPSAHAHPDGRDSHSSQCDFGTTRQEVHFGRASIAAPGAIKGLFEIARDLCRMPVHRIIEPATTQAREGVQINNIQAKALHVVGGIYMSTPESRALFASEDNSKKLIGEGEFFTNVAFADTIDAIAHEGDDLFYRGEISAMIDADCQAGGALRRIDLENYNTFKRNLIARKYRGATFISNPPPSSGGLLISFALALLDDLNFSNKIFGSFKHLQDLSHVMGLANQARIEAEIYNVDLTNMHDVLFPPELLEKYQTDVLGLPSARRGTTHISVVDADGNAAALTVSNGEGSGYVVPDTGIMMNNMLGEQYINPHGFHNWYTNTRMSSTMAPSILKAPSGQITVLGSGGSNRIRTAILQVLVNLADFAMPVDQAINAPRIHLEGTRIDFEQGFELETALEFAFMFEDSKIWPGKNLFFGGVNAVGYDVGKKDMWAASDPRQNG
jgi:gamma-glutamyltranspeptidase/glutathione hydrolase